METMTRNGMKNGSDRDKGSVPEGPICCAKCRHFSYFDNKAGHNSPHALGRCAKEPWDGSRGQWALFQHHCRDFVAAEAKND
jgi:hypothetical protein